MASRNLAGMTILCAVCLLFGPIASPAQEVALKQQSEQATFQAVTLAEGLDHPWGMDALPDGSILITERSGQLRRYADGQLSPALLGVPNVSSSGQGGLLDVAAHPDFANNQLIYMSYAERSFGLAGTAVARARLDGDTLRDVEVIFRVDEKTLGSAHYGSRLAFATDGTLLITIGDRYSFLREAQNLDNHLGALIRIHDDGSIPDDNPFLNRDDSEPAIYSYGHRNPQGLTIRPSDGVIWQHEHGPRGGDEVNIIRAGINYGWPAITYGIDYSGAIISDKTEAPGMEQPVIYWDPSIAPSGMAFYDGNRFPDWRDDLFVGALRGQHLRRLELDGDEVVAQEVLLRDLGARIRDVMNGPDGYLYLLTDAPEPFGSLIRLEPAAD